MYSTLHCLKAQHDVGCVLCWRVDAGACKVGVGSGERGSVRWERQGLGLSLWPAGGCWLGWNGRALCQRCISQDLERKRK